MDGVDGEVKTYIKVWISALACLVYCYFISFRIPKGKFRLFSVLPIFYFMTILPLKLTTVCLISTTAFFFTWLANFKLLLFSIGQGALAANPSISLLRFLFIACSPMEIKSKQTSSPQSMHLRLGIKVLVFVFLSLAYDYKHHMHPQVMFAYFLCYIYLGSELIIIILAALVKNVLGLEFEPLFHEPYLSTSLQDFWGRRWNLVATNILRLIVYQPIMLTSMKILGRKGASAVAVLSTFFVSGLMHDIIYYYIGRARPTWEVTWFFVLQGVLVVLESVVQKAVRGRWRLHPLLSWACTVGILFSTGFWLFFPQLVRCRAGIKASAELIYVVDYFKEIGTTTRISSLETSD